MARSLAGIAMIVVGLGLLATGHATAASTPNTTIVSTSGIPHHDIGDYTKSRSWRVGHPEGITDAWREAIDIAIGQIAAEKPDAVFHTGDMVGGRWGRDTDGVGIFGPTRTIAQRKRAVARAADLYYRQNREWWRRHGLRPHFGIGDHEVGDIEPTGVIEAGTFQYRAAETWRRAWARQFTDDGARYTAHPPGQHRRTAYATMIGDDVGFVSLDPFLRKPSGVYVRIGWRQMRWLGRALDDLRRQGARFLIVQCEVPAQVPNRQSHSSRLTLGNADLLWQLLRDHDVDVLLTGEFHEMSARSAGDTTPVQIVHGGQLYRGSVNYLVIKTFDDRMKLQLKRMYGRQTGTGRIWSPTHPRAIDGVRLYRGARIVGTMTIHADGKLSHRGGYLRDGMAPVAADTAPPPVTASPRPLPPDPPVILEHPERRTQADATPRPGPTGPTAIGTPKATPSNGIGSPRPLTPERPEGRGPPGHQPNGQGSPTTRSG